LPSGTSLWQFLLATTVQSSGQFISFSLMLSLICGWGIEEERFCSLCDPSSEYLLYYCYTVSVLISCGVPIGFSPNVVACTSDMSVHFVYREIRTVAAQI
jgi:hypothetical protein